MSFDFWMGVGAGFCLGYVFGALLIAYIGHYNRTRGYQR